MDTQRSPSPVTEGQQSAFGNIDPFCIHRVTLTRQAGAVLLQRDSSTCSYVRCLDLCNLYEVVRVTHDKYGQQEEFMHQLIFMAEYDETVMIENLKEFGHESLCFCP